MLTNVEYSRLAETLERLEKSFEAVGYPHVDQGGRTGVSALARMSVDPVLHSIAASDKNIIMMKEVKKEKAISSVHQYKVKTSVANQGVDLAGSENFLPQEDASQYENVVEPLKIYGIRKTLGEMASLINEAGGFEADIEKENEINAVTALTIQFERDSYAGGDYYLTPATGAIDVQSPLQFAGRTSPSVIRQARGIQNNIREGNVSTRGVSQDFVAYGNSFSTSFNLAGASLDQDTIDDIASAVQSNGQGTVDEAHCNPAQATEFRKTIFPMQRADVGTKFDVQGPNVSATDAGFNVLSVTGPIKFRPAIFKYSVRQKALPVQGSVAAAPGAPTVAAQASQAITGRPTTYTAGQTVRVLVQACSINGMSSPTAVTCTVTNATESPVFRITHIVGAEYYMLFANPAGNAVVGNEGFIGKVLPNVAVGATMDVVHSEAIVQGYESVVFMPSDSDRLAQATLGNQINKTELGRTGLAAQSVFSSYFCWVLRKPRAFALADNCKQRKR